jgi:hypothetical protein
MTFDQKFVWIILVYASITLRYRNCNIKKKPGGGEMNEEWFA